MRVGKLSIFTATLLAVSLVASTGYAQEGEYMPDQANLPDAKFGNMGLNPWVTIGANVSFGHNYNVVGKQDGQNWTIGASLDTGVDYQKDGHDWRNNILLLETFTYGPPINEWIKSADSLSFKSIYYYKIPNVPWLGPFARFQLETSIFPGADARSDENNQWYKVDDLGNPQILHTGKFFILTNYGFPLTLREAIGLFARPFSKPEVEWEFRAGLGATEVFADGQLALTGTEGDDSMGGDLDGINDIEVRDLSNYVQFGAEAGMSIAGKLYKNKFSYKAWADIMFPLVRTNKAAGATQGNVADLMNVDIGVRLEFKLVSWATLNYEFKAVRQPQLVDGFQIQNLLLLTFKYSPVEKKKEAPPAEAASTEPPAATEG
ncbi:MAG: hypothetical protein ISR64_06475 [Deltaproteobacteria bacterium]|nr:hypothetical protein [Deltaproteobacteria bacterium]